MVDKFATLIQAQVPNYKQDSLDVNVVYYVIEVTKKEQKIFIDKRYSEFDDLQKQLKKLFGNLPELPGKTVFKIKEQKDLENRRQQLDKYIRILVSRQDVYNSDPFKKFLQIENFAPETAVTPPKLINQMIGFSHGVRDFHLQNDKGLLFTLISDMNVASRVDSYITNMKMPWEKEQLPVVISVGAIECHIKKDKKNVSDFIYERVWTKSFSVQAICINWDQALNLLVIGLDDGKIMGLSVSSELNYIKQEEIINTKIHQARVMGVQIENTNGLIYSVSEDKFFNSFDISTKQIVQSINVSNSPLTNLILDKEFKRAFIATSNGFVFIYDVSSLKPIQLHSVSTVGKAKIRGLEFDPIKNYIFTGSYDDGEICLFDVDKPGKEKFTKIAGSFKDKKCVRCIKWSKSRYEVFVGNDDGTITFWNAKKGKPIYVQKAHDEAITQLNWLEDIQILISASKDKNIKFWQLPEYWRDQKVEEEEERDIQQRKENAKQQIQEQQRQKIQEDSDDDDLKGWHNF